MINRTFSVRDDYLPEYDEYRILQFVSSTNEKSDISGSRVSSTVLAVCEHVESGQVCTFDIYDEKIKLNPI